MAETKKQGEPHRLQYHFTPPSKWMNDPNGMVYHKGEYHLFYQHNPGGTTWGPMHWGHAISKDMVSWEHLPIALFPDENGTIFSGSAVIDENNTSGLGTKANPPMVAIYTYHNEKLEKAGRTDYQTQGLAFSLDNGRTWKKYDKNPVLKNPGIRDFRDPKVSWNEKAGQWVMTLAVLDHIEFYGSKNLTEWTKLSEFGKNSGAHGGVWECPDLFPLKVNGQEKWVLLVSINPGGPNKGSATQYFLGDFDGKTFKNDNPEQTTFWVDYGTDNYAGVTWDNIPKSDGRRLFLGWMSNWLYANEVPTGTWRSANTLPRELKLVQTPEGIRLVSEPVKELQKLRVNTTTLKAQPVSGPLDLSSQYKLNSPLQELDLNLDVSQAQEITVRFSNTKGEHLDVGYSVSRKEMFIDRTKAGKIDFKDTFPGRHTAPLTLENGKLNLHLFLDVASVEVFANGGRAVMTDIFFPNEDFTKVELISSGPVQLLESKAYKMKPSMKSASGLTMGAK
ncbi:glycoside hydrolase family 32 protein [Rufibacter latericius]|uniref:Glycoside hydrolase family 32 protein n=1 Tax=Rufibacter latericius TaxID=2487040 RepID=A0A3M9MUX7_9BACT|nr:glycoside hydrolase family 32 protein [Rufibacter latericius]RNI28995.1 glycoside hydrolase family 32 protein [Rufibacter latericius]